MVLWDDSICLKIDGCFKNLQNEFPVIELKEGIMIHTYYIAPKQNDYVEMKKGLQMIL